MQLVTVFFLSSFKVLFVTAPGKENFYVNSWRGGRCFDRLAIKTDHQMPTAGIEPATSSLPWMRSTYWAKSATMCAEAHEEASHDLSSVTIADSSSMLVILVYHTSCRCARENLKIFRFSKGKRGLGAKTPFSVFWCRPKHKKDKKKAFRRFFFFFIFIRRSRW